MIILSTCIHSSSLVLDIRGIPCRYDPPLQYISPTDTNTIYFIFKPEEGNLYCCMKARKALADGLIVSIFQPITTGFDHVNAIQP